MLLALWPLFISTSAVYQQQDISHLVEQFNESKYAQVQHVSVSGNTSQRQASTGSITTRNLVTKQASLPDKIVSTHFAANAATAQSQASFGTVSVSHYRISSDAETSQYQQSSSSVSASYIHHKANASTAQAQATSGTVSAKYASISILANANTQQQQGTNAVVSTHYQEIAVTASTEQQQATSGIVTAKQADSTIEKQQYKYALTTAKAISWQHQSTVGKVTIEDDEMLQVLLALMILDDDMV